MRKRQPATLTAWYWREAHHPLWTAAWAGAFSLALLVAALAGVGMRYHWSRWRNGS